MADTRARIRIEGEDATGPAWRSALGNANRAAAGITASMKNAFGGLGVVSGAGLAAGLTAAFQSSIRLADQLGVLSEKTGISVSALSTLRFTAQQADVDFESLSGGLVKLQRTMAEATTGNKEAVRAFQQLGIGLDQIKGRRADEVFRLVANRISGLRTESDQTKAAIDLFGRSGADLIPILKDGAAGLDEAALAARRLGVEINDIDNAKLRELGDQVSVLSARWDAFKTTVGGKVAPVIGEVLKQWTTDIQSLDSLWAGFLRNLKSGGQLMAALRGEEPTYDGPGPKTRGGPRGPMALAADAPTAARALTDAEKAAIKFREQMEAIRQELYTGIPESAKRTEDAIQSAFGVDPYEVKTPEFDLEAFQREADTMGEIFHEKTDDMTVYADQAARNMQDAFADFLFDPFKGGLRGMLTGFVNILRRMVAEAAAAKIFEALGGGSKGKGGGFLGTILGTIFGGGKAVGGPVNGGMSYLVGERGPEMLTLGRGQSGVITPNDKLRGGGGVTNYITQNISGLGMPVEQVLQVISRSNQELVRKLSDANRRAGLPAPRF